MISYLKGTVHHKDPDSMTLLVGGVGYLVNVTKNTINKASSDLELHVHTHVREDALDLYGFTSHEELVLFKLLINVSGIGPKTALLVIDRGVKEVKQAIVSADEGFFTLVPRLGKKNAQKIIIELKTKLGGMVDLDLSETTGTSDVVDALLAMGFSKMEAIEAVRKIPAEVTTLEEKVKWALKYGQK